MRKRCAPRLRGDAVKKPEVPELRLPVLEPIRAPRPEFDPDAYEALCMPYLELAERDPNIARKRSSKQKREPFKL